MTTFKLSYKPPTWLWWLMLMICLFIMTVVMQSCKAPVHHHHYYIIMEKSSWPHRDEPLVEDYVFKHDPNCSGMHISCNVMHDDGGSCMTCLPDLGWSITNSDRSIFEAPGDTLSIKDDGKVYRFRYNIEGDTL